MTFIETRYWLMHCTSPGGSNNTCSLPLQTKLSNTCCNPILSEDRLSMRSYVTAREVEGGGVRGGGGRGEGAHYLRLLFFFTLGKRHTLNKATIHAIVIKT